VPKDDAKLPPMSIPTPVPVRAAPAPPRAAVVIPHAPPAPPLPPDKVTLARRSKGLSDDALWDECDIDVFVASGPGGQHRNKTESGVRVVHRPTGVVVTATERRSQHENRSHALERLRAKLEQLAFVPKKRRPTKPTRGSKERRLTDKKQASQVKKQRRSKEW
jgi:hypothetical protein